MARDDGWLSREGEVEPDRRRALAALALAPSAWLGTRAFAAASGAPVAAPAPAAAPPIPSSAPPSLRPGARFRSVETAFRFVTDRGGTSVERGRETAGYQFHDDGTIAVRIHSESDAPSVARDAIYTLDAAWRPRECLLRMQVDGRHAYSGWFRFDADVATLEGWSASAGRISTRVPLSTPATALVTHPVTSDAMLAAAYDLSAGGPSMQRPRGVWLASADPYGRTGPELAASDVFLDYAGRSTVETPAGPAAADGFRLHLAQEGRPAPEPLQELWVLAGTSLLLRAHARGAYRTVYELTRLEAR